MSGQGDGDNFNYTLLRPKTVRNKTYESLTVRRPLVRDLIAAERQPGKVGGDAALIAICADIPFSDFGHLDAGDFRAAMQLAEDRGFFGGDTALEDSSSPSTPAPAGDSTSS